MLGTRLLRDKGTSGWVKEVGLLSLNVSLISEGEAEVVRRSQLLFW
jgi:hypothetical protein